LPIVPNSIFRPVCFSSFRQVGGGHTLLSRDALLVVGKEVMLEDDRDAQKQFRVDGWPLEDFVDVGTVAIEFASKPTDGPLLTFKFLLDKLSDVQALLPADVLLVHTLHDGEPAAPRDTGSAKKLMKDVCLGTKKAWVHHLLPIPTT